MALHIPNLKPVHMMQIDFELRVADGHATKGRVTTPSIRWRRSNASARLLQLLQVTLLQSCCLYGVEGQFLSCLHPSGWLLEAGGGSSLVQRPIHMYFSVDGSLYGRIARAIRTRHPSNSRTRLTDFAFGRRGRRWRLRPIDRLRGPRAHHEGIIVEGAVSMGAPYLKFTDTDGDRVRMSGPFGSTAVPSRVAETICTVHTLARTVFSIGAKVPLPRRVTFSGMAGPSSRAPLIFTALGPTAVSSKWSSPEV